jgi:hypothetical protein
MFPPQKDKALRFEAQLTSFSSRADRSLGFRGVTPELDNEEKVALMNLQNVLLDMIISPKDVPDADILEVKKEMIHKSPAQRMRSVIFLLWKQTDEQEPFDTYYLHMMEKIIDWLKAKLPHTEF